LESFIDDLVPKFQALESEAVLARFQAVYENMNLALDGMPYSEIGISDEVKEQVTKSSSNFFLRREFFFVNILVNKPCNDPSYYFDKSWNRFGDFR